MGPSPDLGLDARAGTNVTVRRTRVSGNTDGGYQTDVYPVVDFDGDARPINEACELGANERP